MFRTTIVIVSPTLTFSTSEEFSTELDQYYDETTYDSMVADFTTQGKVLNRTETLTDSSTLQVVIDWDLESSYDEFYTDALTYPNYISALQSAGYTRNVTTETI